MNHRVLRAPAFLAYNTRQVLSVVLCWARRRELYCCNITFITLSRPAVVYTCTADFHCDRGLRLLEVVQSRIILFDAGRFVPFLFHV